MEQNKEKGYTQYQKKVIKGYYENKELRLMQKLGELVSDMYLATNEKKRESGWKRIKKILTDLKVHPNEVEYLTRERDLAAITKKIEEVF